MKAPDIGFSARRQTSEPSRIGFLLVHGFSNSTPSENCNSFLKDDGKDEHFVKCSTEYIQLPPKSQEQAEKLSFSGRKENRS
jgi:hypothetical protein